MCEKVAFSDEDLHNPFSIIHNFEVSVILPFYKKLAEFKKIFPKNAPFFQRNGIEVIVVLDDISEKEGLISFVKEYPFVNWKIIANEKKHEWRNPAKVINVGIRNASKKYIMVCSPESEFLTDAIYIMRHALEYYESCFVIGTVEFAQESDNNFSQMRFERPYGSIMAKKSDFITIGGYNEKLLKWGGDDDNIRARLELSGIKKMLLPDVKLIHRENDSKGQDKRVEKRAQIPVDQELDIYYPSHVNVNAENWGFDFKEIIYDWRYNNYSKELALKYLSKFEKFECSGKDIFTKEYNRILLFQCYNEGENIRHFVEVMSTYFEGIIMLDDGSEDATYDLVGNEKVILKVRKRRTNFNDLENRNILLDLASFFKSEWFCFMDVDEYFDTRYVDFDRVISQTDADVLSFGFVNLWNGKTTYNVEYPFSENGIMHKPKMFRNIGHAQIYTKKVKLHFLAIPFQRNLKLAEIFYLHFGMLSQNDRNSKYEFYVDEDLDHDQESYEHMKKKNSKLAFVEDIQFSNGRFYNKNIHLK